MAAPDRRALHILTGSLTIRRKFSVKVGRNYTSPPMGQLFEARRAEF